MGINRNIHLAMKDYLKELKKETIDLEIKNFDILNI